MKLRDRMKQVKGWLVTAATVIAAGGVGLYSADFRSATEKLCDAEPAYRIDGGRGRPEVCWLEAEGWVYKSGWEAGMAPGDDCTDAVENAKLMQLEGTGPYPRKTLGEKPEALFWGGEDFVKKRAVYWLEHDMSDPKRLGAMAEALQEVTDVP